MPLRASRVKLAGQERLIHDTALFFSIRATARMSVLLRGRENKRHVHYTRKVQSSGALPITCAHSFRAVSKRLLRGYFRRTPFEFHDGESAGTIPYMAPEILKRRPYGRAADWWSAGVVFYKLTTGRVPFRGKTKQALRERIIKAPLKFPRSEDHPHSATAPAKDIIYRLLKKNPVERLGSRNYSDLKAHPFFEQFDWQMLPNRTDLSDIASIAELLTEDTQKGNAPDLDDQRRHLAIDEMTDIPFDAQKPLLCYASGSFKKLIHKANQACNVHRRIFNGFDKKRTWEMVKRLRRKRQHKVRCTRKRLDQRHKRDTRASARNGVSPSSHGRSSGDGSRQRDRACRNTKQSFR
ncbi:hypothetical protein MRX96_016762 [Rhipicephalus microplus]